MWRENLSQSPGCKKFSVQTWVYLLIMFLEADYTPLVLGVNRAVIESEHMRNELTWVEVSGKALAHNIKVLRDKVGPDKLICSCVKANAYGHGLVLASRAFLEAGADWLAVNAIYEARALRQELGESVPIYIFGYVALEDLGETVDLDARVVIYNTESAERLNEEALKRGKVSKIHLKAETGNNRQGLGLEEIVALAEKIKTMGGLKIEGLTTHFSNIEDTTDHSYANLQVEKFLAIDGALRAAGVDVKIRHCANSAATLLLSSTHFEMVRAGISCYGLWPSNETFLSYGMDRAAAGAAAPAGGGERIELEPAMTWKTKVAQVKEVGADEFIGYGLTYRTNHPIKLAILPVGYYDGYDRGAGAGYVLIRGKRAPIRGRICMNIIMVEVTDIKDIALEDEVVLIGQSGEERISAEQFGKWAGTINYEVIARINDRIPRVLT